MKSKPPNSESKILYLRPFKAYNMLRISWHTHQPTNLPGFSLKPDISKGHRILIPIHTVAYIHNFTLFLLDSALSNYLSLIWLARLLEPDYSPPSGSAPHISQEP